jgi:hypothetical protein
METYQTSQTSPDAPQDIEQSASILEEISKLWNINNTKEQKVN